MNTKLMTLKRVKCSSLSDKNIYMFYLSFFVHDSNEFQNLYIYTLLGVWPIVKSVKH